MLLRGELATFGRRQVNITFLAVYLFPAILLAIPLFVIFTRLGLRGSSLGLVIVYFSQTVPVTIYMLRTYFETVPESLEESAALEGASRFQIMRHISIPLALQRSCRPALFVFMIAWNEFLFALLFLVDSRRAGRCRSDCHGSRKARSKCRRPWSVGAVVLTVPIIIFFPTERLLVEGLTAVPKRADALVHDALVARDLLANELIQRRQAGFDIGRVEALALQVRRRGRHGEAVLETHHDALTRTVRRPDWRYLEVDSAVELLARRAGGPAAASDTSERGERSHPRRVARGAAWDAFSESRSRGGLRARFTTT